MPPTNSEPRVEQTERTFIAWDMMYPWGITGIAMVKMEYGGLNLYTLRKYTDWMWSGPFDISNDNIMTLMNWLSKDTHSNQGEESLSNSVDDEISYQRIMFWQGDSGFGILRLNNDLGFELSSIAAGLRRGGAKINFEDGMKLESWLSILPHG